MGEHSSLEALREVGLFRSYGEPLLRKLAAACREVEFDTDELIIEYGKPGHSMYIVLSGSVEIFRNEQVIAISRPYEPVGELALIDSEPRSTSVRALEPTSLLEITENEFERYLRPDSVALSELLIAHSRRLRAMLDVRDRAYDDLSMLLHDLRNFLTVLSGAREVMKELPPESDSYPLLESVLNAQSLMDKTLGGALDRARVDSVSYMRRRVDLLATVRDCLSGDLAQHPDLRPVQIRLEIEGKSREVCCNEFDLRRVVANLVTNAAQASKPGQEVVVTLVFQVESVSICVRDSGSGILPDLLGRIFDTHFSTREGHSGLGLSSCRRIIEDLHGGEMICESRLGHGTRVECRVPIEP